MALLAATLGCASTKVSRVWSAPDLTEDRYRKVMVLVLASSEGKRETAEDRIVAALAREGATAMRSYETLPSEALADRERLGGSVAESGADALLTVRVTSVGKEVQVSEGREQWVPVGTGVDYRGYVTTEYGLYRRPEISELRTFAIETTLWDVASRQRVWACQSDTESADQTLTTADLADQYAAVVAKQVTPYLRRR